MLDSPVSSRQLDDAQVLGLRLFVDDPVAAFHPVDIIAEGTRLLGIVAGYEHHASKLKCGKPHCGVMHNKGFVAQLEGGAHALIGHICGKALFGTAWEEYEGEHLELRERQRLLARKQALLSAYPEVVIALRGWRFAAEHVQKARRDFQQTLPELAAALRTRAARGEAALTVSVQIDRGFAEANQVAGVRGSRQSLERTELVHMLQGVEFFGVTPPRELVEKGLDGLQKAADALAEDNLPNRAMQRALAMVTSSLGEFRQAEKLHVAAQAALTPTNLAGIVAWATRHAGLGGRYEARGRRIVFRAAGSQPAVFEAANFTALDASPVARLENSAPERS